ncbi:MAG: hypothetical protein U9N48_06970 [Euryarchaeota archaeon]|nr:hypothetical protein [Euryarchaeota archaeon]
MLSAEYQLGEAILDVGLKVSLHQEFVELRRKMDGIPDPRTRVEMLQLITKIELVLLS